MKFTVLQWNIWEYEDIRNIAKFLLEHRPDVVCLQELTFNSPNQAVADTPAFIAAELGYNSHYKELPIESIDGRQMMFANGIFSHFPIMTKRWEWTNRPKAGGGYADEYRAYVEATLDLDGRMLTVGTTHMSYTHRFEPTAAKGDETARLLAAIGKQSGNYIFAGDLNAPPDSPTVREFGRHFTHAGPAFSQPTWATKPFAYRGFTESELAWRLDYIFTSPQVKVTSTRILPTSYSDHLPVLAELELG